MKNNLILCGLPGVGKTVTAELLAKRLGWQLFKTDDLLEKRYKEEFGKALTCREIYRKVGEDNFRQLEKKVIETLLECDKSVISIGGGTLNEHQNIELLKRIGKFIYLKNDRALIYDRLINSKGIPTYLDPNNLTDSFAQMAAMREPIYESAADFTIHTKRLTPQEIVEILMELPILSVKR